MGCDGGGAAGSDRGLLEAEEDSQGVEGHIGITQAAVGDVMVPALQGESSPGRRFVGEAHSPSVASVEFGSHPVDFGDDEDRAAAGEDIGLSGADRLEMDGGDKIQPDDPPVIAGGFAREIVEHGGDRPLDPEILASEPVSSVELAHEFPIARDDFEGMQALGGVSESGNGLAVSKKP